MVWLEFIGSAALLVVVAMKLAEYGDVISIRTRLGGMFVGTLLMAAATSLPEFLTSFSSLDQGVPNLAAGNLFGSCMFNMLLIAILDAVYWRAQVLRRVALRHALTASLATLLMSMAVFFILADFEMRIAWIGLDSLALVVAYVAGMRLLQAESPRLPEPEEIPEAEGLMPLWRAMLGFGGATVILVVVTPMMVRSSVAIAEMTGLSTGFVGAALVGMVTSLPEMITMFAAARLGAYDLAVGNLFGSNMFNMFGLGATDILYPQGRFLHAIDPSFALAGLIGLVLTSLGLINNLSRSERRIFVIETDALLLMLGYFLGLYFLYTRGISG